MSEKPVTQKDLRGTVQLLFEDFLNQLQQIEKPAYSPMPSGSDRSVVATDQWYLDGSVSVFDEQLEVDVKRLWRDDETGQLSFDPTGNTTKRIILEFRLDNYSGDEWRLIVDALDEKIKNHPCIVKV